MLGEGIEQLCVFAVFCVLGVVISAIYVFAVGLTKTRLAAIIFDSIFGVGAIFVTWWVNLQLNNGECRAFLFVALALGAAITYFTCKRTLDKLSAMLYNMFTKLFATKQVDEDGTHILQEVDSGNIRGGDTTGSIASLHAAGQSGSTAISQGPHS